MKIAVQMDEISSINVKTDSTLTLLREASLRNYEIFYYLAPNLSLCDNKVVARGHKIKIHQDDENYYEILQDLELKLDEMDVILIRQDPPFDLNYITATYLLEKIKGKTIIVNDPAQIRNCPEKLLVHDFYQYMPPTLISLNLDKIQEFRQKHDSIIIKPLYGYASNGVFHIKKDDNNLISLHETLTRTEKTPLIAQKYLPEIKDGDKRVILINGEITGFFDRIIAQNEVRSAMRVGADTQASTLNEREKKICNEIGLILKEKNLIFAGLDLIGGYVTEINLTSPTGINSANKFCNISIEKIFWDHIEKCIKN